MLFRSVTDPDNNSMESALQNNNSHLRITFVDASGKALYDTNADVGYMENHRKRPEIAKAFEDGSGEAIRKSETMGKSAFYYAVRLACFKGSEQSYECYSKGGSCYACSLCEFVYFVCDFIKFPY